MSLGDNQIHCGELDQVHTNLVPMAFSSTIFFKLEKNLETRLKSTPLSQCFKLSRGIKRVLTTSCGDLAKSWIARIPSGWRSNTPCTTPGSFLKPRNSLGCMNCECMQSNIWLINLPFHPVFTFLYLWVKSSFSCSVHLLSKSALKSILSLLMRSSENKEERAKERENNKNLKTKIERERKNNIETQGRI